MSDRIYLTRDGYNRLKEELHLLTTETRKEVLEKIAEARSHGDLSENAEYDAAREEQSQLEAKFRDCVSFAARPLAGQNIDRAVAMINALESLDDAADIVRALN